MKTTPFLALLCAVPLVACTTGDAGGDDSGGDDGTTPATDISGSIATNQTLSGRIRLADNATVEVGVVLTISAGTVFEAVAAKALTVKGTLQVEGAAGQEVQMRPVGGAASWTGIVVDSGVANVAYVQASAASNFMNCRAGSMCTIDRSTLTAMGRAATGDGMLTITRTSITGQAGVFVNIGGDVTVEDTTLLGESGDTIVMSGGTLTMSYSDVGNANTTGDHCAMHLNANSVANVTYSNIRSTPYGLMISNTTGAVFNFNNFLDNSQDVDRAASGNTNANFQNNYYGASAPNPPTLLQPGGFDFTNTSATPIAGTGPRP